MVWNDEQIKKWTDNYRDDFDKNKKIVDRTSIFACILNLIFCILFIFTPKVKAVCPYLWSADIILFYYECKHSKLIWFPIKTLDKIVGIINKLNPLIKDKNKEEILCNKKAMKQLKKTVRLINKYEKFMQKHYEKN